MDAKVFKKGDLIYYDAFNIHAEVLWVSKNNETIRIRITDADPKRYYCFTLGAETAVNKWSDLPPPGVLTGRNGGDPKVIPWRACVARYDSHAYWETWPDLWTLDETALAERSLAQLENLIAELRQLKLSATQQERFQRAVEGTTP